MSCGTSTASVMALGHRKGGRVPLWLALLGFIVLGVAIGASAVTGHAS
jgi:hypothetical protein